MNIFIPHTLSFIISQLPAATWETEGERVVRLLGCSVVEGEDAGAGAVSGATANETAANSSFLSPCGRGLR
jgi:hypothetical protein